VFSFYIYIFLCYYSFTLEVIMTVKEVKVLTPEVEGTEENHTVSRREVLKASWSVPVVMAVAPSMNVLAGSGGGDGDGGFTPPGGGGGGDPIPDPTATTPPEPTATTPPEPTATTPPEPTATTAPVSNPTPDYAWDKSSMQVTAAGCNGAYALFKIKNGGDGDMAGPHVWEAYVAKKGTSVGDLVASGTFQLNSGDSIIVGDGRNGDALILSGGGKRRLFGYQHPLHPGNSRPTDTQTCG
jgi:hypothetical protein